MIQAQYLHVTGNDGATKEVLSPWMSRGSDNIRFTVDLIDASNASLTVQLLHKNSEDSGNGGSTGATTGAQTSSGRYVVEFEELKELVRYKFIVTLGTGTGYAFFRMLPPVWFDSVAP